MITSTTLKKPIIAKPYSTVFKEEEVKVINPRHITKIVFIPEGLTALDVYEAELLKAGYSKLDVKEIIEGLKESPLYEGKAT